MREPIVCTVCDKDAWGEPESRSLLIYDGVLRVSRSGETYFDSLADERAIACGQHHALILVERYIERGTFAPADFVTPATEQPTSLTDTYADLT